MVESRVREINQQVIDSMKYYTYIIENKYGAKYIGQTSNIYLRLERHNENKVFSTSNMGPWKLVYSERFGSRGGAMKRERLLKKQKGGDVLKRIIASKKN